MKGINSIPAAAEALRIWSQGSGRLEEHVPEGPTERSARARIDLDGDGNLRLAVPEHEGEIAGKEAAVSIRDAEGCFHHLYAEPCAGILDDIELAGGLPSAQFKKFNRFIRTMKRGSDRKGS